MADPASIRRTDQHGRFGRLVVKAEHHSYAGRREAIRAIQAANERPRLLRMQ
jgi:hypothetical protein